MACVQPDVYQAPAQFLFCQAHLQLSGPQHIFMHDVVPSHVQGFDLPLFELLCIKAHYSVSPMPSHWEGDENGSQNAAMDLNFLFLTCVRRQPQYGSKDSRV